MSTDDRGHAPVEEPAHPDLLARRLGVHVHQQLVDLPVELVEDRLDLHERRTARAQVQVAAQVDDAETHAIALHHRESVSRLAAQVVGRTHDALLSVQVRVDLLAVVRMVAQRDDVDPRVQELVGDLRRDPESARDVLAVDHDESGSVAFTQLGKKRQQGPAPESADEVADEEDARGGVGHGAYSGATGR